MSAPVRALPIGAPATMVPVVPGGAPDPGAPGIAPVPAGTARVALLGASGYTGLEFLRLARTHPGLGIAALVSREWAGRPARDLVTGLAPGGPSLPDIIAPEHLEALFASGECDTLVSALPHGVFAGLAGGQAWMENLPARIVDLSADRRDGSHGYLYGLPEMFRRPLSGARRVANPGCYPTAATLALLPALEAGLIDGPVTVSALSGVTGAGRAPALRTSFAELDGGASLYKVGHGHNHVAEMRRNFARLSGGTPGVAFAPVLAPMARGLLVTVTARLARPVDGTSLRALYAARYAGEPFVALLPDGDWPDTRLVRGGNRCDVAVLSVHDDTTIMAMAAIDNLVKGAAGQAIQNLNLMLGWPDTTGLTADGSPW